VLHNKLHFLLLSSPGGRPFKTDLGVTSERVEVFPVIFPAVWGSGPGRCALAGLLAEQVASLREGAAWKGCVAACCWKPQAAKAVSAF